MWSMAMNEENQQAEEQTVSVEFEEQGGEVKVEAQDSEETGTISYFKNGERTPFNSYKELNEMLSKDMD